MTVKKLILRTCSGRNALNVPSPIFLYGMTINKVKLIFHQRPTLFPRRQNCCQVKINNSEPSSRVATPVTGIRVSMENPGFLYFSIMRYYFLFFILGQSRNVYSFPTSSRIITHISQLVSSSSSSTSSSPNTSLPPQSPYDPGTTSPCKL